jgi:3-deoxy-D-manno-octulosonate 8-phosphate phosphatase (KDO 8-P phosphatase)
MMRRQTLRARRVPADVIARARRVRLVLVDVDGVLTDGRIFLDGRGRELRAVHVRDAAGIALMVRAGIRVVLVVDERRQVAGLARTLAPTAIVERGTTGVAAARRLCRRWRIDPRELAFVGDDLLDQPLFAFAGLALGVADGASGLARSLHWSTSAPGGSGAVREVAELVLQAQGKWASTLGESMR